MSKIVENDRNLLKDALAEYNAIKEEAIKVAKNRLAESMPDVIEKFLKEELENHMEEGILSTEDGMTKPQESSVMDTMKKVDSPSPVSESDDIMEELEDELEKDHIEEEVEEDVNDDELTAEAIAEALAELEGMNEGMDEEDEEMPLDEHDLELNLSFDDEGLHITGDADGDEIDFEDEFEVEFDDEDEMSDEMEPEDEEKMEPEDEEEYNLDLDSLEDEEEVEEGLSHVITHQNAKQAGSENHVNHGKAERLRPAMQESALKKDIEKLIKENEELKSINLEFKDALKKYKTQLYEMAVFNANLSHVNNLFVEHTTTVDEKKDILNKFKSVATIEESKSVYNQFVSTLNESKKTKKTIEEMVEKPSVNSDSGLQKINESIESQKESDSVKAIKKMMKYIETRKK